MNGLPGGPLLEAAIIKFNIEPAAAQAACLRSSAETTERPIASVAYTWASNTWMALASGLRHAHIAMAQHLMEPLRH